MGGGIDHDARSPKDFASLHQPTLVRTIEAWRLVTEQPDAGYPVVLTGGGFRRTVSESSAMQQLLLSLGMDSSRLFIKETSIDTASNAVETSALFKEMGWSKKVRLVTSALHMVRAKATFERQGFEVCAIAEVDVQAIKGIPWYSLLPQTTSLLKFKKLLHELVGYLVYKVRGTVD